MFNALLLTFVFVGGLVVVLSIPMALRRIGPNWFYGFRTLKTMRDPDIWYDANAYAGKCMLLSGIVIAAFPVVLHLLVPSVHPAVLALTSAAVTFTAVLASTIQSLRYLSTLD